MRKTDIMKREDYRPSACASVLARALRATIAAVLVAACGAAMSAHAAEPTGQGKRIALIVQAAGPDMPVDQKIKSHLEARGYAVSLVEQDQSPDAARDADLIVMSSTISAKRVAAGWRQLPKPLLTWENDLLDDLAMTGKRHDVDFGEAPKERYVWLVNAPHPMAAGLPAGAISVYNRQAGMSWGKPGLGASIIATLYGQPEKAAIFAYEKGATMDYESLAPARRVMFFLDNDTFTNLAAPGRQLFDAAVDWAAGLR